jgi:hypothetical protein
MPAMKARAPRPKPTAAAALLLACLLSLPLALWSVISGLL